MESSHFSAQAHRSACSFPNRTARWYIVSCSQLSYPHLHILRFLWFFWYFFMWFFHPSPFLRDHCLLLCSPIILPSYISKLRIGSYSTLLADIFQPVHLVWGTPQCGVSVRRRLAARQGQPLTEGPLGCRRHKRCACACTCWWGEGCALSSARCPGGRAIHWCGVLLRTESRDFPAWQSETLSPVPVGQKNGHQQGGALAFSLLVLLYIMYYNIT